MILIPNREIVWDKPDFLCNYKKDLHFPSLQESFLHCQMYFVIKKYDFFFLKMVYANRKGPCYNSTQEFISQEKGYESSEVLHLLVLPMENFLG